MRILEPDFDQVADLPGIGLCPRPVDIRPPLTGFARLLALRIDELPDSASTTVDSRADEVLVILLAGAVDLATDGPDGGAFRLDVDGAWAAALPPGHRLSIAPLVPSRLARVRARVAATRAPGIMSFRPGADGSLSAETPALRLRLRPLGAEADAGAGLPPDAERLVHLTGPARLLGAESRDLPPAHTLVLAPGESAAVAGEGEILAIAALPWPDP